MICQLEFVLLNYEQAWFGTTTILEIFAPFLLWFFHERKGVFYVFEGSLRWISVLCYCSTPGCDRDALQWDDPDGAGRHQTGLYSGQAMMQEIILFVLYIEHRICYNVLYDRQNEQWEKLLQTTICWRKLLQPWPNRTTISSWPTRKILTLR